MARKGKTEWGRVKQRLGGGVALNVGEERKQKSGERPVTLKKGVYVGVGKKGKAFHWPPDS